MTKNPFVNALAASIYIIIVALVMNVGMKMAPHGDTWLAPVGIISLFTLSAAVMGFIFCYSPAMLYFDGKKKIALQLFLQTVGCFAIFTFVALGLLFSGFIR